jgi:aryl-alcohol dehydrogenase-like predicted oxidoreductase
MPYGIANRSGVPESAELAEIVRVAGVAGVRQLDTARGYGASEEVIGELVGREGSFRVVTKLDHEVACEGGPRRARVDTDASLADSARALRRERLDGVLLHRTAQLDLADGAAWSSLVAARDDGRVDAIGASAESSAAALPLVEREGLDIVQAPASLLDQRLVRAGWFADDAPRVEVFVRSVFVQGLALLDPDALPSHLEPAAPALRAVRVWAESAGRTLVEVYLGYARDRFAGANVVVGAESAAQVEELLAAWRSQVFTDDELLELEALTADVPPAVVDPTTWPAV